MQDLTPEEMYGIAKKFNAQLMNYPMHTHSAVMELARVGMQHRNLAEQKADRDNQIAMQERAMKLQEQQVELARAEQRKRDQLYTEAHADRMHLVPSAAKDGQEPVLEDNAEARIPEPVQ